MKNFEFRISNEESPPFLILHSSFEIRKSAFSCPSSSPQHPPRQRTSNHALLHHRHSVHNHVENSFAESERLVERCHVAAFVEIEDDDVRPHPRAQDAA